MRLARTLVSIIIGADSEGKERSLGDLERGLAPLNERQIKFHNKIIRGLTFSCLGVINKKTDLI